MSVPESGRSAIPAVVVVGAAVVAVVVVVVAVAAFAHKPLQRPLFWRAHTPESHRKTNHFPIAKFQYFFLAQIRAIFGSQFCTHKILNEPLVLTFFPPPFPGSFKQRPAPVAANPRNHPK